MRFPRGIVERPASPPLALDFHEDPLERPVCMMHQEKPLCSYAPSLKPSQTKGGAANHTLCTSATRIAAYTEFGPPAGKHQTPSSLRRRVCRSRGSHRLPSVSGDRSRRRSPEAVCRDPGPTHSSPPSHSVGVRQSVPPPPLTAAGPFSQFTLLLQRVRVSAPTNKSREIGCLVCRIIVRSVPFQVHHAIRWQHEFYGRTAVGF